MRNRTLPIVILTVAMLCLSVRSASADYVGTAVNRIFLDPESISVVADGYDVGDVVSYILETTPRDTGSTVGAASWATLYVPPGVEVVGAEIVAPNSDGTYSAVPAEDVAAIADGCGKRKCAFPTTGTYQNGKVNEVQQDTGIFYSTDPQTALLTTPLTVETTGSSKKGLQSVYNQWDYNQVLAFGAGDKTGNNPLALSGNRGKGNTPVVQIGSTWYGTGSPVAGPDTYYTNDYDPDCDASSTFELDLHCTGPWQRIKYPNAKIGGSGAVAPTTTAPGTIQNTSVATTAGHDFSVNGALPANTNAVRFVNGIRRLGDIETARITFRITDPTAFTASFNANEFCLDSTGSDTDKAGRGAQDNPWRYYEGNNHKCYDGSASGNLFKQTRYVNGVANPGFALSPGDVVGYEITFTNTGSTALSNVSLTDTAALNLTLLEPGNANCPYTSYDGDLPGPSYTPGSASGGTATWGTISSLGAGQSVTVHICGQVNAGLTGGEQVKNRAQVSYDTGTGTETLTSETLGTVASIIAGTVYRDNDGSGTKTAGDTGLSGVTVELYQDNNGDGMLDGGDTLLSTLQTNPDGSYQFTGYPAGNYVVVETNLPAYDSSGDADTVPPALCNTGNTCDVIAVTLATNGSSLENDFFDATSAPTAVTHTWAQVPEPMCRCEARH
ncbi:MAG: DUF11 domain-containing protein [Chloroflexi bacterium]|nr:MAG: DUF11 domain-containing protein [Chloroflexota bacterium]